MHWEAPTTVEALFEDVTMGVRNAVREVEELSGWKLLTENKDGIKLRSTTMEEEGADIYATTSSAGGGLRARYQPWMRLRMSELDSLKRAENLRDIFHV